MAKADYTNVSYKTYIFHNEKFDVRQDFWEAFDACPEAFNVSDRPMTFGVGTDDFTMNHSNLSVVMDEKEVILMSRPSLIWN